MICAASESPLGNLNTWLLGHTQSLRTLVVITAFFFSFFWYNAVYKQQPLISDMSVMLADIPVFTASGTENHGAVCLSSLAILC